MAKKTDVKIVISYPKLTELENLAISTASITIFANTISDQTLEELLPLLSLLEFGSERAIMVEKRIQAILQNEEKEVSVQTVLEVS